MVQEKYGVELSTQECQGRREGVPLRRRNRVPPARRDSLNWEPGRVRSGAGVRRTEVNQE